MRSDGDDDHGAGGKSQSSPVLGAGRGVGMTSKRRERKGKNRLAWPGGPDNGGSESSLGALTCGPGNVLDESSIDGPSSSAKCREEFRRRALKSLKSAVLLLTGRRMEGCRLSEVWSRPLADGRVRPPSRGAGGESSSGGSTLSLGESGAGAGGGAGTV